MPVEAGRKVSKTFRDVKKADRAALNSLYHVHTWSM